MMACGAKVDQRNIESTMKLVYAGPRFGHIGQISSLLQPQTLFQGPMKVQKIEPKEEWSDKGRTWLAKSALFPMDRGLNMSFFGSKALG